MAARSLYLEVLCNYFPTGRASMATDRLFEVAADGDDGFKSRPHLQTKKLALFIFDCFLPCVTSLPLHFLFSLSWCPASRTIWTPRLPGSRMFPDLKHKKSRGSKWNRKQDTRDNNHKASLWWNLQCFVTGSIFLSVFLLNEIIHDKGYCRNMFYFMSPLA